MNSMEQYATIVMATAPWWVQAALPCRGSDSQMKWASEGEAPRKQKGLRSAASSVSQLHGQKKKADKPGPGEERALDSGSNQSHPHEQI